MAASGTTKKITSNQILGAGGTATLASATITGKLTALTVSATESLRAAGPVPANLTSQSVYDFLTNSSRFLSWGNVSTDGQFQWYTGLGGAAPSLRMTLNATGLGVGVTPTIAKVQTNGAFATTGAVGNISGTPLASALIADFNTTCRLIATGANTSTAGVHKFIVASSNASVYLEAMEIDVLGNVIIRSPATPATLTTNGQLTVNATSNTNLRFSYRGSDGTTRVANLTLA
jgi:hypothetical protein